MVAGGQLGSGFGGRQASQLAYPEHSGPHVEHSVLPNQNDFVPVVADREAAHLDASPVARETRVVQAIGDEAAIEKAWRQLTLDRASAQQDPTGPLARRIRDGQ